MFYGFNVLCVYFVCCLRGVINDNNNNNNYYYYYILSIIQSHRIINIYEFFSTFSLQNTRQLKVYLFQHWLLGQLGEFIVRRCCDCFSDFDAVYKSTDSTQLNSCIYATLWALWSLVSFVRLSRWQGGWLFVEKDFMSWILAVATASDCSEDASFASSDADDDHACMIQQLREEQSRVHIYWSTAHDKQCRCMSLYLQAATISLHISIHTRSSLTTCQNANCRKRADTYIVWSKLCRVSLSLDTTILLKS